MTGTIRSKNITESSGIAASRCQKDVLWTHNDSGDDAFILAIDLHGDDLGSWKVSGARNVDWEDIAEFRDNGGKCFLYIGDIGDNKETRDELVIYRVAEPQARQSSVSSEGENPQETESSEMLRFRYPDGDHNAETLMVHPKTGEIYVLTKKINGPAGVYRIHPAFGSQTVAIAEKIGEVSVPAIPNGLLTGGDISPDGTRVILCDYTSAYELILPDNAPNFDEIWKQKAETINTGDPRQGEAIGFSADGMSIFVTSEGKHSPVIEIRRKN